MKKKLVILGLVLASPIITFATTQCTGVPTGGIQAFICKIGDILNTLIPILIIVGVVFFIIGVIQYVIAGDEEAKKKGKNRMIFGIIGLVVIVGMWGLVNIVTHTFSIDGGSAPILPVVQY